MTIIACATAAAPALAAIGLGGALLRSYLRAVRREH